MFIRDLEVNGLSGTDLVHGLARLTGDDVQALEAKDRSFAAALNTLAKTDRETVLNSWLSRLNTDPLLARSILSWTNSGESLTSEQMKLVLDAALPILVLRKDLRQKLVANLNLPIPLPERLAATITTDEDEARRLLDEEQAARQARQNYFRSLAEMPFENRVVAIVTDKSIDPYKNWREWQNWRSRWSQCSDEEIDQLSAESTQQLIDMCEASPAVRFPEVLPRLYDRRHKLRHLVMDDVRRKCASTNANDQLTNIVTEGLVGLQHYPVELAKEVSPEWLAILPDDARRRFLSEIGDCKLKVWVRARLRLKI